MKLEASLEDMSEWREVDFALNCTYIVHDQASEPNFSLPKAMTSIPRNLTFQYSSNNQVTGVFSKEYIPQGTRFGPLHGVIYTKENVPLQTNRKYFWRGVTGKRSVRDREVNMPWHVCSEFPRIQMRMKVGGERGGEAACADRFDGQHL
ncbi:PR domain zinc finger protein 1-like [Puntigrus tetrazona]|uniref:PR domain zinc finger protein 1-like n=1 Tax=Puntigrus tetrazona TaxID=1606681 RepID=UPI001C8A5B6F|nr:PR domain zinc finger protein 1-like [Puntigrus tetrazona]